jgi:hypothetical protein
MSKDAEIKTMAETIQSLEAKNKAKDIFTVNLQEKVRETSSFCMNFLYLVLHFAVCKNRYTESICLVCNVVIDNVISNKVLITKLFSDQRAGITAAS